MNKILLVAGVVLLVGSFYLLNQNQTLQADMSKESIQKFIQYKISQNKKYSSSSEESYRLAVYTQNMLIAQAHNANPTSTWTMGETQFSDLTQQEFAAIYLTLQTSEVANDAEIYDDSNFVSNGSVDWRTQPGVASKVKNQGQCGSCWAFAAVGTIEALYATVKGQKDLDLSEQQLVDCNKQGSHGCDGGDFAQAIIYAATYGLTTQSAYPYTGRDGDCRIVGGDYKTTIALHISPNEPSLQSAISLRPVAVAVDACNWFQYTSGILSDCGDCGTDMKNAALAYGYDQDHWLLKNQWGTRWGESGFIRIKNGNTCSVLSYAMQAM